VSDPCLFLLLLSGYIANCLIHGTSPPLIWRARDSTIWRPRDATHTKRPDEIVFHIGCSQQSLHSHTLTKQAGHQMATMATTDAHTELRRNTPKKPEVGTTASAGGAFLAGGL